MNRNSPSFSRSDQTVKPPCPVSPELAGFLAYIKPEFDDETACALLRPYEPFEGLLDHPDLSPFDPETEPELAMLQALLSDYAQERRSVPDSRNLSRPQRALKYVSERLQSAQVEELLVVCLDQKGNLLASDTLFRGTADRTRVCQRTLGSYVLAHKAEAVVLAHNHPNGTSEPSPEDDLLTKNLVFSLLPLHIKLTDHFILSGEAPYSYRFSGKLATYERLFRTIYHATPKQLFRILPDASRYRP